MNLFSSRKRPTECFGYVDSLEDGRVSGWVRDRWSPGTRLDVEIFSGGTRLGSARADLFRPDLAAVNIGDGRYGFSFEVSGDIDEDTVAAKVAGSDFWLINNASQRALERSGVTLMNSAQRGLPVLRPGLSFKTVDERDIAIADDLLRAWQMNVGSRQASADQTSMWDTIVATQHGSLLKLLNGSDPGALATRLVEIQKHPESWGLVQGDGAYRDFLAASPAGRRAAVAPFHDMLASLAQYCTVRRAECAEQHYVGDTLAVASADLAGELEAFLGHPVAPPTVFDGLYGLAIGDRILHARDIQALYAALRVVESSGVDAPRICEIGGGFGKVAHYAFLRGVRHYTIVDLPTVSAMQYFYLRRVLPDVPVRFVRPTRHAEHHDGIALVLAQDVDEGSALAADIVLNCDSFPEMGDAVCQRYFSLLPRWAPLLLSINQEGARTATGPDDRQSVVGGLLPRHGFRRRYRFRSWIRAGYVEELWSAPPPPERTTTRDA